MKPKVGAILLAAALVAVGAQADSVTHGGTTINMDFVDIGYAGNTADSSGYGSVANNYRIGTYSVTVDQWDAVRLADPEVGNAGGNSGTQPTAFSSWLEAAKFANWLTSGSYNGGAYLFSDANTLIGVDRAAAVSTYGTVYVLPTEDEWYKAAYFKSDGSGYTLYATGDAIPVAGAGGENYDTPFGGSVWNVGTGIVENNGTYDMNGNLWEWNESAFDGTLDNMTEHRVTRGGSYDDNELDLRSGVRGSTDPTYEGFDFGFRVAAIPEPSSIAMIGLVSGCAVFIRRRLLI